MVVTFEIVEGFLVVGPHHIRDILCRVQIAHFGRGMLRQDVVAYRMDQVSLPEANAAIDKKWVVGSAGVFGHLQARSARQLVSFADNETVEGEFWN